MCMMPRCEKNVLYTLLKSTYGQSACFLFSIVLCSFRIYFASNTPLFCKSQQLVGVTSYVSHRINAPVSYIASDKRLAPPLFTMGIWNKLAYFSDSTTARRKENPAYDRRHQLKLNHTKSACIAPTSLTQQVSEDHVKVVNTTPSSYSSWMCSIDSIFSINNSSYCGCQARESPGDAPLCVLIHRCHHISLQIFIREHYYGLPNARKFQTSHPYHTVQQQVPAAYESGHQWAASNCWIWEERMANTEQPQSKSGSDLWLPLHRC